MRQIVPKCRELFVAKGTESRSLQGRDREGTLLVLDCPYRLPSQEGSFSFAQGDLFVEFRDSGKIPCLIPPSLREHADEDFVILPIDCSFYFRCSLGL
jgi:hypothetical protein